MIFKHFFVGVKLLLRHKHLSMYRCQQPPKSTDLRCFKDNASRRLTCSPFDRRSEQFVSTSVVDLFVGRRSAGRPGLNFASVGQASDSGSGRTWRTNRPVDSADHACGDYSVRHHVSLMVGNMNQPGIR
jgi:hypothetical protein